MGAAGSGLHWAGVRDKQREQRALPLGKAVGPLNPRVRKVSEVKAGPWEVQSARLPA